MKKFSRQITIAVMYGLMSYGTVQKTEAGIIGDLWDSVVGFFTGKKKVTPEQEAQIKAILSQTERTQNQAIAMMNPLITELSNAKNPPDAQTVTKLEQLSSQASEAISLNNQSYLQLMEAQKQLQAAGLYEKYAEDFLVFMEKQKEIENNGMKIEEKYNEVMAFASQPASEENKLTENASGDEVSRQAASALPKDPWKSASAKSIIDRWLSENNRDEWGGVKVEGAIIGRPQAAAGKDRYEFLYTILPQVRELVNSSAQAEATAPAVVSIAKASDQENAPAAPVNSVKAETKTLSPRTNMAFANRYENAGIRTKRDEVYRKMMKLSDEGKAGTEEHRTLMKEYMSLSKQME